MNLKAKIYVENQKKRIQEQLAARLARLKEKGLKDPVILRDATVRRLKALVRKMDSRLAAIAALEKITQERAQAKIDKAAAEKAAKEAPKAEPGKKGEGEKKEKKVKKEKGEKPPKGEGKPEGKPEGKKEKKEAPAKPEKAEKKPDKEEGK